jgi:D-alanyl-D-alanine carboxypeptidase/D-alanyl-D-alanine-endopeptidase (penicillin-binding protein 4)
VAVLTAAAGSVYASAPATAAGKVETALAAWTAGHPGTGAMIVRLDPGGGVVVASHKPGQPFIPASTQKLITSAGALTTLGPDFRFPTRIYTSAGARLEGGTLRGPLYMQGGGDPVLATGAYARAELGGRATLLATLARPLKKRGIRRVAGPIVADESIFDRRRTGRGWLAYYTLYSPPLSGLPTNQAYAGNGQARYSPNPAKASGQRLRAALQGVGVAQGGDIRTGRTPTRGRLLATARSPRLGVIAGTMNRASDNHIAETLLKGVGAHTGGRGTSAAGARAISARLRTLGILGKGDRIVDGSGLSRDNRLSAASLARLVAAADRDRTWGRALISSLPRGGEGTLRRRFTGSARKRVRAKTGYINGVSTLAGRVISRRGAHYAFALMMNDPDIGGAQATQNRIVALLASGAADR